jgi:hypothetical protein
MSQMRRRRFSDWWLIDDNVRDIEVSDFKLPAEPHSLGKDRLVVALILAGLVQTITRITFTS